MSTVLITLLLLALAAALSLYMRLRKVSATEATLHADISAISAEKEKAVAQVLVQTSILEHERETAISRQTEDAARISALEQTAASLRDELAAAREVNASLTATLHHAESGREEREKQLEDRFRNLANEILRQNSADFKARSEERLAEILSPLRTNIDEFRKTVTDTYSNEARERFSLTERIRELVELNNTISREARELSSALKGNNRVQGDWGEMVLETILEKSGLIRDEEYFIQATTDDDGKALRGEGGMAIRPDVVVRYPDNRFVVIDSKVSLTAFIDYVNAEDDATRKEASSRHVRSVKSHVEKLSRKNYHDYVGAPDGKLDFVMMFIPNEPAYIAAMRLDPGLWQEAYDHKVLIVSPTHLVSGLRLIAQLWSRDKVTRNAIRIAEDAGKMYDKFADFTLDMERIEKALASASKAHQEAVRKLSSGTGNLVKRARDLHDLGIKAQKQLAASMTRESDEE